MRAMSIKTDLAQSEHHRMIATTRKSERVTDSTPLTKLKSESPLSLSCTCHVTRGAQESSKSEHRCVRSLHRPQQLRPLCAHRSKEWTASKEENSHSKTHMA